MRLNSGMSKQLEDQAEMVATKAPFGAVYFGAFLVTIGVIVTIALPGFFGAVILLSGVMVACTGMIVRAISRIGY